MKTALTSATLVIGLSLAGITSATTVGTLTHDTGTHLITDSATGTKYLRWNVLADKNCAQTLDLTVVGGAYHGFHIASQTEAYTFFNAAGGAATDNIR